MGDHNELVNETTNAVVELVGTDLSAIPSEYQSCSIEDIPAFGAATGSLQRYINEMGTEAGGEGIYKVTFPKGFNGKLSKFKYEDAFLGSGVDNGKMAQARLTQVELDPTQMMLGFALMAINQKLGEIQETQQEILSFLKNQEESKVYGYLQTLNEMVDDYRLNGDNEDFIEQKKKELSQIRIGANTSKSFYQKQMQDILSEPNLPHVMSKANVEAQKLISYLQNYRLALYVKEYEAYLETIFLRNFKKERMLAVSIKIKEEGEAFEQLIEKCKVWIDQRLKSSIDYVAGPVYRGFDSVYEKVTSVLPFDFDKAFAGDKEKYLSSETQVERIEKERDSGIIPFSESLKRIERLQDEQVTLLVSGNKIYLPVDTEDEKEEK